MNSLFIALPLPKSIKNQLERLCFGLPQVHWAEHGHFLLSVLNIGPTDGTTQVEIQEALSKISLNPFKLSLQGVGYYPSKKAKGVIWVGVVFSDELNIFKKMVESQISPFISKIEDKSFVPHITLGYFETVDKRRLLDYLDANSPFSTPPFLNDSFLLMKRQNLPSERTIYQELASYKLIPPVNKLQIYRNN